MEVFEKRVMVNYVERKVGGGDLCVGRQEGWKGGTEVREAGRAGAGDMYGGGKQVGEAGNAT